MIFKDCFVIVCLKKRALPCPAPSCPALPCPAVRRPVLPCALRALNLSNEEYPRDDNLWCSIVMVRYASQTRSTWTAFKQVLSAFQVFQPLWPLLLFLFLPSESNLTKVLVTYEKSLATSSQTCGMFLMVSCQNFFNFSRVSTLLSYAIITYGYLFGTIFKMRLTKKLFKQWSLFHFYLWSGAYQK